MHVAAKSLAYFEQVRRLWLLWRRCSRQRPCTSGKTRVSPVAWTAGLQRYAVTGPENTITNDRH